ncbi:MAG: hypothetical protein AABX16_01580 [Nanoarchaeota archaeon]
MLQPAYALIVDSVSTDTNGVAPGEVTDVEIGLKNNEEDTIKDVSISLDLANVPFAPSDTSSEFGIDEIREGKLKYARFSLIVLHDAQPNVYKIPIKTSYHTEGSTDIISKTSLISITVVAQPVLNAHAEESVLIKGQNNELSIKIINQGTSDVQFLEVTGSPSTYVTLLSTPTVYIGNLDSDDFDSVTYSIFLKNTAPDTLLFPITIRYKDALQKTYTQEFTVAAAAYTEEGAISVGLRERSYTLQITILVILLIVFYLLYRFLQKKLKQKKMQEKEF